MLIDGHTIEKSKGVVRRAKEQLNLALLLVQEEPLVERATKQQPAVAVVELEQELAVVELEQELVADRQVHLAFMIV